MAIARDLCREAALAELPAAGEILGTPLTVRQVEQLGLYCSRIVDAGKEFNLTAIQEPGEIVRRHFLDSLSVLGAAPQLADASLSVVDVGTGAGFPGLVLAIALPACRFTLVDSTAKKIRFVEHTAGVIGLANVRTFSERVEAFGRKEGRATFDLCVARAVAATSVLIEYCAPLVRTGGQIALYKSGDMKTELEAARAAMAVLGCRLSSVEPVSPLLGAGADHVIVLIDKVSETPSRFPRRVGVARKRPLYSLPR